MTSRPAGLWTESHPQNVRHKRTKQIRILKKYEIIPNRRFRPFTSGFCDRRVGAGSPWRMRAAEPLVRCLGSTPRPHPRALHPRPALLPAVVPRRGTAGAATGKSPLLPVRPLSFLAAVIYGKSGCPGGGAGREAQGWGTRNLSRGPSFWGWSAAETERQGCCWGLAVTEHSPPQAPVRKCPWSHRNLPKPGPAAASILQASVSTLPQPLTS